MAEWLGSVGGSEFSANPGSTFGANQQAGVKRADLSTKPQKSSGQVDFWGGLYLPGAGVIFLIFGFDIRAQNGHKMGTDAKKGQPDRLTP